VEKYHNPLVAEGELKSGVEKYHNPPLVAEGELKSRRRIKSGMEEWRNIIIHW
jgi:hypothetical protein